MTVLRTLKQDFFKEWSPDMAYILGYFAADGCMLSNSRGGYYIEFTSTDRILLEHVQKVTGSNHFISTRPERSEKYKASYRLQIGSKEWYADLTALGFTQHKSHTLVFPDIPEECLGPFTRGYFDGDGCVYLNKLKYADRTYKRWVLMTLFTSGSREFLESLASRLRPHGVKGGSFYQKERGFDLRFSHRDSLALYALMYDTAPTSELCLPRKREKLERAIQVLGLDKGMRS
jgi:intein/homing endonuclease